MIDQSPHTGEKISLGYIKGDGINFDRTANKGAHFRKSDCSHEFNGKSWEAELNPARSDLI